MLKNIGWWAELDGKSPIKCILSYDDSTPKHAVDQIDHAASGFFNSVSRFWYPSPLRKAWPAAPNWAWQNTARFMAAVHSEPWLWLESDAIAIRKGWLLDIAEEHQKAGKPFSGHIVTGLGHCNGVCVYPPIVAEYAKDCLQVEEMAWDVVLGRELSIDGNILKFVHPAHTLFQHCWAINPADGKAWNGHGEVATFKNTKDVVRLVDLTMGLFHRNKDGTLIDMLRLHYSHPELAMVPDHTIYEEKAPEAKNPLPVAVQLGREEGNNPAVASEKGPDTASVGVPVENNAAPVPKFTGQAEILIVTYGLPTLRPSGLVVSDFDWLAWCLRCIRKHCRGFRGITVAIPNRDADALKPIAKEHAESKCGIPFRIQMFPEREGKGMLHHMAMMAGADQLVPKGVTHVLHVDADCMFKEPVTPDEYFVGDKPVYVVRTWESLIDKQRNVVSDCHQWKAPTDAQLGMDTQMYTMTRHPTGFPIGFYPRYREHVEKVQGRTFFAWMIEGKNSHPANRMDFTAMGGFAWAEMKGDFHWIDISEGNHLAPKDKQKCFWSHGGISPAIQRDIEGFLK